MAPDFFVFPVKILYLCKGTHVQKIPNLFGFGLAVVVEFVLFGTLYQIIPQPFGFLLINGLFVIIICLGIVNYFISNRHRVE